MLLRRTLVPLAVFLGSASAFSVPPKVSTAPTTFQDSNTQISLFFKKQEMAKPVVVAGVGEDGCALPAPSQINTLSLSSQAGIVLGIFAALGIGTSVFSAFLGDITMKYEWVQTWRYTWPLLGAIYAGAGATHFTLEKDFCNIYPSPNAWGIWKLPGSAEFHVKWTGIAELLGGVGLLMGGAIDAFGPVWYTSPNVFTSAGIGSDCAAALFLLTIAVTPANIFMYTHGAKLPIEGPEVPVVGHAIRGVMQVVLLSLLYQMGEGTFDALLSN